MSATAAKPTRYCDMVMKGGISSGVVYPLAIVKLAEQFHFKNLGGTSAGAIAAAAAAAAEHSRASGGFEKLKELPTFLEGQAPGGRRSNLVAFFQPQPATARVFRVALAGLGGGVLGVVRVLGTALLAYALPVLLGALPGLAFLWGADAYAPAPGLWWGSCVLVALALTLMGMVVSMAVVFWRDLTTGLAGNFYGLCSGMPPKRNADGTFPTPTQGVPLTPWLQQYLNEYVERSEAAPPLTFSELWRTSDPTKPRHVNLEMMTTCLTHGRPYRLPLRDDPDVHESRLFYFREDEFLQLFPKPVVDWMLQHPAKPRDAEEAEKQVNLAREGFYPLPSAADFPVCVAVRMSLSFPVLLSAIPLHAVDHSRPGGDSKPERCWFSDGGVCSNFPLHFFDSPLPRWPTLSINLVDKPKGTSPTSLDRPEMPGDNSARIQEHWNRFELKVTAHGARNELATREKSATGKLVGFMSSFISTMQNWTDNSQSRLPGYRDRIAHVGLAPEEGGLNLNMPPGTIKKLTARGEATGEEFIARFGLVPTELVMHWQNHRWLRLRATLAAVESLLRSVEQGCAQPQPGDQGYEQWVQNTPPRGGAPSYDWSSHGQHALAQETLERLRALAQRAANSGATLAEKSPRPRPEYRQRPRT